MSYFHGLLLSNLISTTKYIQTCIYIVNNMVSRVTCFEAEPLSGHRLEHAQSSTTACDDFGWRTFMPQNHSSTEKAERRCPSTRSFHCSF